MFLPKNRSSWRPIVPVCVWRRIQGIASMYLKAFPLRAYQWSSLMFEGSHPKFSDRFVESDRFPPLLHEEIVLFSAWVVQQIPVCHATTFDVQGLSSHQYITCISDCFDVSDGSFSFSQVAVILVNTWGVNKCAYTGPPRWSRVEFAPNTRAKNTITRCELISHHDEFIFNTKLASRSPPLVFPTQVSTYPIGHSPNSEEPQCHLNASHTTLPPLVWERVFSGDSHILGCGFYLITLLLPRRCGRWGSMTITDSFGMKHDWEQDSNRGDDCL